jgi:hypothetical protein
MRTHVLRSLLFFCLMPMAHGYKPKKSKPVAPPDPVLVARLTSAKTVFVANLGADRDFSSDIPGGANVCYNEFYASLKQAGSFELVDDPVNSDLIFAIGCTEQIPDIDHTGRGIRNSDYTVTYYSPFVTLSILDPKTKVSLYTSRNLAGRGSNIPKGVIAFANSINGLTKMVLAMVGKTPPLPAPAALVSAVGPLPPRLLQAKTVFLRSGNANGDLIADLTAALTAWGRYTIVDTPEKADLILEVWNNGTFFVNVYTVSDQVQIWTVIDPNIKGYTVRGKKLDSAAAGNLITAFKTLRAQP